MNKRAFTLIEVIAIIAVLGIMAVLVLPKISGSVKDRKESQYNNIVTTIENAAKVYYADNQDAEMVSMQDLADQDYLAASIINPVTGSVMNGCVSISKDSDGYNIYEYLDDCSTLVNKIITLNLNGGASSQTLNSSYLKGDAITLTTPTKSGVVFNGWSATCTSCLSGNTYTVGSSSDTISANWENTKTITLNLNGGTSSQTLNSQYIQGNVITLTTPTKTGYTLYRWSATCTSCLSGNTYTVGTINDTIVANWVTTVVNYDYTGNAQTYIVPATGYYKIEAWGASGGLNPYAGPLSNGYGGYAAGAVYLSANQTLYVYVGGQGNVTTSPSTIIAGGYNGGGQGYSYSDSRGGASGGGATHIATTSGLLSTLSSNQSAILMVAGGGGGADRCDGTYVPTPGNGGGYVGNYGVYNYNNVYAYGGTQTEGGAGSYSGSFGQGANCTTFDCAGGGGGYYGGAARSGGGGYGGGGSGYIANSLLLTYGGVTKAMYCYNCTTSSTASTLTYSNTNVSATATSNYAKSGNGYARITFISI